MFRLLGPYVLLNTYFALRKSVPFQKPSGTIFFSFYFRKGSRKIVTKFSSGSEFIQCLNFSCIKWCLFITVRIEYLKLCSVFKTIPFSEIDLLARMKATGLCALRMENL